MEWVALAPREQSDPTLARWPPTRTPRWPRARPPPRAGGPQESPWVAVLRKHTVGAASSARDPSGGDTVPGTPASGTPGFGRRVSRAPSAGRSAASIAAAGAPGLAPLHHSGVWEDLRAELPPSSSVSGDQESGDPQQPDAKASSCPLCRLWNPANSQRLPAWPQCTSSFSRLPEMPSEYTNQCGPLSHLHTAHRKGHPCGHLGLA